MRALLTLLIILTAEIMTWILWKPVISPLITRPFNRDQPPTPTDWTPRYWTMRAGTRTEGPWT